MPLPRSLARFNRRVTNVVTRPFAARLPGFCVLHHAGRVTQTRYATPLNAWRGDDGIVVALTYGSDVDWLANAMASDSSLVMGGEELVVGRPTRLRAGEAAKIVPAPVRAVLRLLGVDEFVAFPILRPG